MAKKKDFRPDSDRKSLLQRFYLTPLQRRKALKWALYSLMLVVLSVVQDVVLCDLQILKATTDLVPCGIFLICILEGTQEGCIFTLLSSLIYLFTGTAPGYYAMVLITVLAIVISAFRQNYLKKGFLSAMLCIGAAMLLYELALFAIGLFLGLTYFVRIFGFLTTAILSLLASPPVYFLAKAVYSIGGESWKD